MTLSPLVSVIVPVYNVEAYLDQCIESILAQSHTNMEILVVDDGSTDSSGALCDRWAERDARISVIHQPNGGLSAARNTALDVMTGQLVTMVDSDDVLHPDFIATLLDAMSQHDADIAVGGYQPFYDNGLAWPTESRRHAHARCYSQHEALQAILYQRGLTHSAWGRLYRAELFDGIRYPVGKYYEDFAIIYPLLKRCSTVVHIDTILYGYRQRDKSILQTFSSRRADVLDVGEQLETEIMAHDHRYAGAIHSRLLSAYFNILLLSHQDKSSDHSTLQGRCWNGIKRLRNKCLLDPRVRIKNKMGILVSYLGQGFLCNIVGRNYQPRP